MFSTRSSLIRLAKRIGISYRRLMSMEAKPKKGKAGVGEGDRGIGKRPLKLDPPPEFIAQREVLWDKLKKEYDDWVAAQTSQPIKVTLPDGKVIDGQSWKTTPYEVAAGISQGLADSIVIAKVNDELWDLDRPFEGDASLKLLKFDDPDVTETKIMKILTDVPNLRITQRAGEGLNDPIMLANVLLVVRELSSPTRYPETKRLVGMDISADFSMDCPSFEIRGQYVFWHSSAHILGEAMECHYGGHLCYGPPVEGGFYYDMWTEESVSSNDFPNLETLVKGIVKEKQPFERLEVTKENLLKMFEYNKFKQRILNEKVTTPTTTVYKCGPLIDLCRGPHVRHTGKVKAFTVTKNSSTYWEGNADAETLQRIYGISFPDPKQLKEWKHFQEEAAKRDHRKIGRDQELFFFHDLSPGSCFFLPKGAHIYNTLVEFIRKEYWKRGFTEVVSPNIYNHKLWEISGHWQHYAENMFQFDCEKEKYALKPMNCPGHCLMFDHRPRSWRELPLRMADFGVLHRNELSGALSGLTRVRRFQQDDAHIFCRPDQIKAEIEGCLDFLKNVYGILGFTFDLKLSTRPEKFLGEISVWDNAEKQLSEVLDAFGQKYELNPGDGAFYGPKIDIVIMDALRRSHQCATIQLDFQLPERFGLTYINDQGERLRPVIVHRAVLGSVERMMAILCENFGGKWPFWLSPRQSIVIPVAPPFDEYAEKVKQQIHDAGFLCDHDLDTGTTMNKKIRNAQLAQYNFIFVVGEKEVANNTVNVRTRDNKVHGEHSVEHVIERFNHFKNDFVKDAEDSF